MSFANTESATKQNQGEGITAEFVQQSDARADETTARYALMLGDDALMLGQRLGWWISRAPEMEEDVALANIALDLIGHARFFLSSQVLLGIKPKMTSHIFVMKNNSVRPGS